MLPCGLHTRSCGLRFEEKPARTMTSCLFPGSMGRPPEGGVQKQMIPSLLYLLFFDAFSDHACGFLCVSMHLEAELLTHEEIPTQCGMTTQEWMTTQHDQASDTCMANGLNLRGNPTARRTQPSLPASQALVPCARQPGFRARQALLFAPKSTLHESRHVLGKTLYISILAAHNAQV